MLIHVHTSSTLCGKQLESKGKVAVDSEKEKEAKVRDQTLAPG
jgi:hypothetical protein